MTRETLLEILSDLGDTAQGAVRIRKERDVSVHVGRPGEGLEVGPIEEVELRKSHVRVQTVKGQTFLFPYEDVSMIVAGAKEKEKRTGFGG